MSRAVTAMSIAVAVFAGVSLAQTQEEPPTGAFKAVHLVNLSDAEVASVQDALADINAVVAKAGYADIRYRLYRVEGKQNGEFKYMWESEWPSGAVYQKVHDSPEWGAAVKRHPELDAIMKKEVYNRYVEVMRTPR